MRMLAIALVLAGPAPAIAQSAQPSGQAVELARMAAARDLVALMNVEQTLDFMFAPMVPVLAKAVIGTLQGDPTTRASISALLDHGEGGQPRFEAILSQEFFKALRDSYPEFKEATATEYAKAFTEQELRQVADFYRSGPGAKLLKIAPDLQKSMAAAGQAIGRKAGEKAGRRAFERAEREMLPQKEPGKS